MGRPGSSKSSPQRQPAVILVQDSRGVVGTGQHEVRGRWRDEGRWSGWFGGDGGQEILSGSAAEEVRSRGNGNIVSVDFRKIWN